MSHLADWQTFLAVQAGAAATLTGLVFVAVSLNLSRILSVPGLPGRAAESLLQLLQVFFIASATLVPSQPAGVLAAEVIGLSAISWLAQTLSQVRYARLRANHPLHWLMLRVVISQLATGPFVIAAIALLFSAPWAFYWMVPGFFFSVVGGVVSAWVLLIEILR